MRVSVANHLGEDAGHLALRRDVYSGLQKTPKSLPPKWFYDTVGSELFDHPVAGVLPDPSRGRNPTGQIGRSGFRLPGRYFGRVG